PPGPVRTQPPLSLRSVMVPPETPKSTAICRAAKFLRRWLRRSDELAALRAEFKSHMLASLILASLFGYGNLLAPPLATVAAALIPALASGALRIVSPGIAAIACFRTSFPLSTTFE